MTWIDTEFHNLDLGDERLNKRATKILETLAKSPKSSIPESCQGWTDTQGTYRFYANEKVTSDKLLEVHTEKVEERICNSDSEVILCLQDTTELDFYLAVAHQSRSDNGSASA